MESTAPDIRELTKEAFADGGTTKRGELYSRRLGGVAGSASTLGASASGGDQTILERPRPLPKNQVPDRLKGFLATHGVIESRVYRLAERAVAVNTVKGKQPLEPEEHAVLVEYLVGALGITGSDYREQYGLNQQQYPDESRVLDEFLGVRFTRNGEDSWNMERVSPKTLDMIRDGGREGTASEAEKALMTAIGMMFKKVEYTEPKELTLKNVADDLSRLLSEADHRINFRALFEEATNVGQIREAQEALRGAWKEFLDHPNNRTALKQFLAHKHNWHASWIMNMLSGVGVQGGAMLKDEQAIPYKRVRAMVRARDKEIRMDTVDSVIASSFAPLLAYLEQKSRS